MVYKVAIIGCGKRAISHVPGLQADERCNVVALADVNKDAAEQLKTDCEFAAAVYTDYQELLAQEEPDVVVTCLWTRLHLPVFRSCAQAGVKAVLSEKPMAPTWGEALEMASIAEQTGCQLTFCHQRRFAEGNLLARKLIAEGVFGKIERMDLYSPKNLLDCGTHTFDQAISFNAETPARWVLGAVDAGELVQWFDVSAECMAVGAVTFENGVRASIQVGVPDRDMLNGVRVIGDRGFLEVSWAGKFLRGAVYNDPSWRPPETDDSGQAMMIALIREALDCLESGKESEVSYKKALRAGEIIFAFYESVRRHAGVQLPLTDVTDNPFLSMLEAGHLGPGQ